MTMKPGAKLTATHLFKPSQGRPLQDGNGGGMQPLRNTAPYDQDAGNNRHGHGLPPCAANRHA